MLDAEIYAMLTLRQELISLGWGSSAQVRVIAFASDAVQLDMDPAAPGVQLTTTPDADADANGISDVEEVLRSLRKVHSGTSTGKTDFEAALQAAISTLTTQPPPGPTVMFFLSDGLSDDPWVLDDELALLDALEVDRTAWGFGAYCDLSDLRRIDPFAQQLTSTAQIIEKATARSRAGAGDGRWLEPGMAGVTIYLDTNGNGVLDAGEPSTVTMADDLATSDVDETGWYAFTVSDGLSHCLLTIPDALGQGVHGVGAALDNQLDQAHVIEGGNLLALFRPDVGVDQVAHRRLIRLEVDVVAAGEPHLVAYLGVVVHLGLDLFDLVGRVPRLGQFAGDAGIGAQQSGDELVEFQAFRLVAAHLDRGEGPMTRPGRTGTGCGGRWVHKARGSGGWSSARPRCSSPRVPLTGRRGHWPPAPVGRPLRPRRPHRPPRLRRQRLTSPPPVSRRAGNRIAPRPHPGSRLGAHDDGIPSAGAEPHREADHLARIRVRRTR